MERLGKSYFARSRLLRKVFVDLLSVFRQASWKPGANTAEATPSRTAQKTPQSEQPLASAIMDTLLCVLVDSPAAIRAFEEAKGVELVVKLLKRAAIPRDVRYVCYFPTRRSNANDLGWN